MQQQIQSAAATLGNTIATKAAAAITPLLAKIPASFGVPGLLNVTWALAPPPPATAAPGWFLLQVCVTLARWTLGIATFIES